MPRHKENEHGHLGSLDTLLYIFSFLKLKNCKKILRKLNCSYIWQVSHTLKGIYFIFYFNLNIKTIFFSKKRLKTCSIILIFLRYLGIN